jgi:hypothetical protein
MRKIGYLFMLLSGLVGCTIYTNVIFSDTDQFTGIRKHILRQNYMSRDIGFPNSQINIEHERTIDPQKNEAQRWHINYHRGINSEPLVNRAFAKIGMDTFVLQLAQIQDNVVHVNQAQTNTQVTTDSTQTSTLVTTTNNQYSHLDTRFTLTIPDNMKRAMSQNWDTIHLRFYTDIRHMTIRVCGFNGDRLKQWLEVR